MDTLVLQDPLPMATSGGPSLHPDSLHGPQFHLVVHFGAHFLSKLPSFVSLLYPPSIAISWTNQSCYSLSGLTHDPQQLCPCFSVIFFHRGVFLHFCFKMLVLIVLQMYRENKSILLTLW